jgi:hypothetical protein
MANECHNTEISPSAEDYEVIGFVQVQIVQQTKKKDLIMSSIKDLVKKHFNLVDAPAELSFGEIKTADGELTLAYEGEELAQGLAIFVVTADGQVPAPDGEHALEGGITIVTADGKIEAIKESEPAEVAEEEVVETALEEEMSPAEAVAEEVIDEVADEVADVVEAAISEEVVAAVAEAVSESVGEMMKKYEERMASLEAKFQGFASAPAAEKTIAGKTSKFKTEQAPSRNAALVERMIALKTGKK